MHDGNRQSHPKMLDKLYTCKWKNGTLQTARVVERRLDKVKFYVGFHLGMPLFCCGGDQLVVVVQN